MNALREQIKQELLRELQGANEPNTSSIITQTGGGAPSTDTGPKLSEDEMRVARAFGMTPEDYIKWKNKT